MMTGSNRQLRKQARRCALILALMLLFSVCAVAESDDYWICPECTRGGNTGNFCTNCGTKRPEPASWTCSCGAVNTGNFCTNCGAKKPE